MRRLPGIALLLLPALLILSAARASAQIYFPPPVFYPRYPGPRPFQPPSEPVRYPVEIGEYVTVGGAANSTPGTQGAYAAGTVGLYAQWNRYGLCPGLDLRIQGNSSQLHGYLVGPRVVYQPRGKLNPFRPYAEALFGKNEAPYNTANQTFNSITGTTRAFAIGLDLHSDSAFAWRVIEFTKGDFTGIPGSHPQTITTGIVLHLP